MPLSAVCGVTRRMTAFRGTKSIETRLPTYVENKDQLNEQLYGY